MQTNPEFSILNQNPGHVFFTSHPKTKMVPGILWPTIGMQANGTEAPNADFRNPKH